MSQNNIVMAFRKRLKKRGYSDVSIFRLRSGRYRVSAVDPLVGILLVKFFTLEELNQMMR